MGICNLPCAPLSNLCSYTSCSRLSCTADWQPAQNTLLHLIRACSIVRCCRVMLCALQVQPIHVPPADVPAYHLLHVHKDSVLQPYGFRGRESHRIPLVPAIVDKLHPQHRVVLITPPPGEMRSSRGYRARQSKCSVQGEKGTRPMEGQVQSCRAEWVCGFRVQGTRCYHYLNNKGWMVLTSQGCTRGLFGTVSAADCRMGVF